VGPGAGLERCGKSRPTGIRSPDLPAPSESLYRLRYPGSRTEMFFPVIPLLSVRQITQANILWFRKGCVFDTVLLAL
jgi:hypothetical protein